MYETIVNDNWFYKSFLDADTCNFIADKMDNIDPTDDDIRITKSKTTKAFNNQFIEIHYKLTDKLNKISGKSLLPTKNYSRIYTKGAQLVLHRDKNHCEFSMTVNLKNEPADEIWPFYTFDDRKHTYLMEPGDAVYYAGPHIEHWRSELEYEKCYQIFFHWVDANGSNSELGVKNYKDFI